jgi:hypothetical protein
VAAWLRGLGLERYEGAFRDNDVDAAVLPQLTVDDLINIGVTSVGPWRKLLAAMAALAREQQAKLWELRAAASIAGLRCEEGRRAEARHPLAPVYGWFTEGFDTPDLKEAKALLDALADQAAGSAGVPPVSAWGR